MQLPKKDSEYIIPDSNSRYLTESDISGLSLQQLNYAKNEIYARRGRKFDSVELQEYLEVNRGIGERLNRRSLLMIC